MFLKKRGSKYSAVFYRGKGKSPKWVSLKTGDKSVALRRMADMTDEQGSIKNGLVPTRMSWERFKTLYLETRSREKSKKTLEMDRVGIMAFESFRAINYISEVDRGMVREFRYYLKDTGLAPGTVNRYVRTIRTALAWGQREGLVLKALDFNIGVEKEPDGKIEYFTKEELTRLVNSTTGMLQTCMMLGGLAGLRRGEMMWLNWGDINFENNTIHVVSKPGEWEVKGGRARLVPMNVQLRAHLETVKPFRGSWVLQAKGKRPTKDQITNSVRYRIKQAGLEGSCHSLRHTFGSILAAMGVPLNRIKEMMGHRSITTTEAYLHLAPSDLQDAIEKFPKIKTVKPLIPKARQIEHKRGRPSVL